MESESEHHHRPLPLLSGRTPLARGHPHSGLPHRRAPGDPGAVPQPPLLAAFPQRRRGISQAMWIPRKKLPVSLHHRPLRVGGVGYLLKWSPLHLMRWGVHPTESVQSSLASWRSQVSTAAQCWCHLRDVWVLGFPRRVIIHPCPCMGALRRLGGYLESPTPPSACQGL